MEMPEGSQSGKPYIARFGARGNVKRACPSPVSSTPINRHFVRFIPALLTTSLEAISSEEQDESA